VTEACEAWRERNMGSFEGFTRAELRAQRPAEHDAWRADPIGYRPAGGESFRDHRARVAAALERIKDEHLQGHVLVVTHGGCIYAALAIIHGAELPPDPRLRVGNTSVTTLRATEAGWEPELVDCVSHLREGEGRAGRL